MADQGKEGVSGSRGDQDVFSSLSPPPTLQPAPEILLLLQNNIRHSITHLLCSRKFSPFSKNFKIVCSRKTKQLPRESEKFSA